MKAGGAYVVDPWRLVNDMRPSTLGVWLAMWAIDPSNENRADLRAAEIASAVVNAQGAKKLSGDPFTPEDFMHYAKLQVDPDELARREIERDEAQLVALFESHGDRKAHRYLETD